MSKAIITLYCFVMLAAGSEHFITTILTPKELYKLTSMGPRNITKKMMNNLYIQLSLKTA